MIRKPRRLLCMLTSLMLLSARAVAAPRLALIADPALRAEADILTVALAARDDLILLERDEIDRVLREQGWTLSMAGDHSLNLGRLLGADGVLFMNPSRIDGQDVVVVQLSAVRPGVILAHTPFPRPSEGENIEKFVDLIMSRFAPLFRKMDVNRNEAIPVSVLNMRAALESDRARRIEESLTGLLISRLVHEKKLFVLERREMEAMRWEKDFAGVGQDPFWSGCYVVDGGISFSGVDQEVLEVVLRIRPPGSGELLSVKAKGQSRDLPKLADTMAEQILQALQRQTDSLPWDPLEEARQYLEEAKWAYKWKLFRTAAAAADASWALGNESEETAMLRIKANGAQAIADNGGRERSRGMPQGDPLSTPEPDKLIPLLRAMDLYKDYVTTFSGSWADTHNEWHGLGSDMLEVASVLLKSFHESGVTDPENRQRLAAVRAGAWEISRYLREKVEPQGEHLVRRGDMLWPGASYDRMKNVFFVTFLYGCYWCEKPQDILPVYRGILALPLQSRGNGIEHAGSYVRERGIVWRSADEPWLVAWDEQAKEGLESLRAGFLKDLLGADVPEQRLDGLLIALRSAETESDIEHATKQLLETLRDLRDPILAGDIDGGYLTHAWNLSKTLSRRSPLHASISKMYTRLSEYYLERSPDFDAATLRAAQSIWMEAGGHPYQPVRDGNPDVPRNTNALVVSQFWPTPTLLSGKAPASFPHITSVQRQEGKMWLEAHSLQSCNAPTDDKGEVVEVRLDSFDVMPVPFRPPLVSDMGKGEDFNGFAVTPRYLYFGGNEYITQYDRRQKTWKRIHAPLENGARIWSIDEDLYLVTADALLKLNPVTGELRTLISTRRRPPVSVLDEIGAFDIPLIWKGRENEVRIYLQGAKADGGVIYALREGGDDWVEVLSFPDLSPKPFVHLIPVVDDDGVLFYTQDASYIQCLYLRKSDGVMESLMDARRSVQMERDGRKPKWSFPFCVDTDPGWNYHKNSTKAAAFDGQRLWIYVYGPQGNDLWCFSDAIPAGVRIPLFFNPGKKGYSNYAPYWESRLFATKKGLFLLDIGEGAGFWFIPLEDLHRFIKTAERKSLETD